MNWPADVSCVLQRNLSFHYVWNWPIGFGGVEVMNRALVTVALPVQKVSANERPRKSTKPEIHKPVFSCNFSACNFSSSSARAVQMHKMWCHRYTITQETDERHQKPQKSPSRESAFSCNFAGCNFSGAGSRALQMHKKLRNKEEVRTSLPHSRRDYSGIDVAAEGHLTESQQAAGATEEHVQQNKGKTNTRKRHQAEKPTTNTNTESTEQFEFTCTPRKCSRIAQRENTEQVTRKTASPKKLDSHTKKRVHVDRPPNTSSKNVCYTANDAKKA